MFNTKIDVQSAQSLIFRLLVVYRWISLLPPLIWLVAFPHLATGWMLLALAAGLTLFLTVAAAPVNRQLVRHPWLLGFDLLFSVLLIWATDVERSPYYLYSLAPILAAAFFFGIRGGVLAAATYTAFYLAALALPRSMASPLDIPGVVGQIISFYLIGAIFGYPSLLLRRLQNTHTQLAAKHSQLARRNRDLSLMQELSLIIQSSVDPSELQESILRGLVHDMGYSRAMIGLYDEHLEALTSWITLSDTSANGASAGVGHTDLIPLKQEQGPLARALNGKFVVEISDGTQPTASAEINSRLNLSQHYIVLPMNLRGHAIGVILVDELPPGGRLSAPERSSLDRLATQAGVAMGSIRLCIDRAQRQAVVEERNRIALDLHDNVSQALYGTAYGLEACTQLLTHQPKLREMLTNLHATVTDAQAQMRKAIFDMKQSSQTTAETFVAGLHRHLHAVCPVKSVALRVDLPGDFDRWAAATRSQLYRVAQEALTNTLKHANASQIIVKLSRDVDDEIELRIADDGEGFNPSEVNSSQHLGIQSMAGRVEAMGGALEINSAFGEGTLIIAKIPGDVPAAGQPANNIPTQQVGVTPH